MCLLSLQLSSDVEEQLVKKMEQKNVIHWMMRILTSLVLLYQLGALSYERTYSTSSLANRVPPDKSFHYMRISSNKITRIALNNINNSREVTKFNTDLASLLIDSCVTSDLTGLKSGFIEGLYYEFKEHSSDITVGKVKIISEGILAYKLKDDNGDPFTLLTKIVYTLQSKFRLISP